MARYLKVACKLSRKIGMDLNLKSKGFTDLNNKCKLKNFPGVHGLKRRKSTNYSLQLQSKQMLKYMYGVLEKQFKIYYFKAYKSRISTGTALLEILESRLDNVVYRMGFASTRAEARQLVSHKCITVKRKKNSFNKSVIVTIPSYLVDVGDIIEVRESKKKQSRIINSLKYFESEGFSDWLNVDVIKMSGTLIRLPKREELSSEINERFIVEFYSK